MTSILLSCSAANAGIKAKSQFGRAGPMMGLLLIRLFAVVARYILDSGSQSATYYYLAMEVR